MLGPIYNNLERSRALLSIPTLPFLSAYDYAYRTETLDIPVCNTVLVYIMYEVKKEKRGRHIRKQRGKRRSKQKAIWRARENEKVEII